MKTMCLVFLAFWLAFPGKAQLHPFHSALVSDTHVGSPNGSSEQDLRRTVADINARKDLAFVVITGDITELGTDEQLRLAKHILDSLRIPYYIIPGNHDTGWSESGGLSFTTIFGNDRFLFKYAGITFLGCASGPYVRMSDGHIPRDAINWMKAELSRLNPQQPVIFFNHYPLDNSLDNWYEAIDALKKRNTIAILCGHGHSNHTYSFEGIPGLMGRSNLRVKDPAGGYNIVDVRTDSILFAERRPGTDYLHTWAGIKIALHHYDTSEQFPRPSYAVNDSFPGTREKWLFKSDANVISTPAVTGGLVVFGNKGGKVMALYEKNGRPAWSYQTGGPIFSSPAAAGKRIVLGSADGSVYCLQIADGKLMWRFRTQAAVLGSPLIEKSTVYIGASDHRFYALSLSSGKLRWHFDGLNGPVVSTPVSAGDQLIFGAWDTNLYALNKTTGRLNWKWNNGSPIANYSPAACIPVIHDGVVYVVAPDRYLTAINLSNGKTLWRTNEATVRESIGISEDGNWVYGKTMNDTIVAFHTGKQPEKVAWKLPAGFGYEHAPSMPVEKGGLVFFGTRNGRVYAIDPRQRQVVWVHKVDHSMVNTVRVPGKHEVIASTMDGKVTLLEAH